MILVCKASLTKLAVLAAPAIERGPRGTGILARLAGNAGARAGQGAATSLGNFFTAECTVRFACTRRHAGSRKVHRFGDRVVDLILHGTVARPTACHCPELSPKSSALNAQSRDEFRAGIKTRNFCSFNVLASVK